VAKTGAPRDLNRRQEGFTLIEVLVALVIIAIATAGLIRATEGHIDQIRALQSRAAAQWVAENKIAELTVTGSSPAAGYELVPMLGETWRVLVRSRQSDDPELAAMTISVGSLEAPDPLVSMDFFVERPATPR
jgi:general secretion pathway protein I